MVLELLSHQYPTMLFFRRHYFHGTPAPRCPYSGFVWLDLRTAKKYITHMGNSGKTNAQALCDVIVVVVMIVVVVLVVVFVVMILVVILGSGDNSDSSDSGDASGGGSGSDSS